MSLRLITLATCIALLTSCSKPAPEAPKPAPAAAATPSQGAPITKDNQGVLTDTEAKGMNQANQVGNMLKNADEERRKQMEAAAGR